MSTKAAATFLFPPWLALSVVLFAVLVTTLAAIYPAFRAAKTDPVAAWVLLASWQASAVAMLVLVVQAACGRVLPARWRHALWWLVVARLLLIVAPTSDWSLEAQDQADQK